MGVHHRWTTEDIKLLEEMRRTMTVLQISQRLRLSYGQVAAALKANDIRKNRKWTPADLERIKELWKTRTLGQVAIKMGTSPQNLRHVLYYYKIRKEELCMQA